MTRETNQNVERVQESYAGAVRVGDLCARPAATVTRSHQVEPRTVLMTLCFGMIEPTETLM